MKQRRGLSVLATTAFALLGCASGLNATPLQKGATASEHRTRVVKTWPEEVIQGGQRIPARMEIVFDYTDGVAIHRLVVKGATADAPERVLSSKTFEPGYGVPRPSSEEIQEALDIVRGDKEIAKVISATKAVLDGGFQIFEPAGKPCGPGTRCLKVQLMTDNRLGFIRNVIVDLTKQAIVYSTYLPSDGEGKAK